MNHELIIAIIPFVCGTAFGIVAGVITAGALSRGKAADLEKQAWASAEHYYKAKAKEMRKNQLNQSL